MKQLVAAIDKDDHNRIANLILSMQRLWPDTLGLKRRRIAEAALVKLADTVVPDSDLLKIVV